MDFNAIIQNPYLQNEYVLAILVIFASYAISQAVKQIFKRFILKFTQNTKTDIDDRIVAVIFPPIVGIIVIIGIHIAFRILSILDPYEIWINGLLYVVYALIISVLLSRIMKVAVKSWFKATKKYEKTPNIIGKIVSIILYLIAGIVILDHFDIAISPMIATLGIGGLAIGLALQSTLANLFAGMQIISDKPIEVNDFIELPSANIQGWVEDIKLRSTRIRTYPNNIVIVPNSMLINSVITNMTQENEEVSAYVSCGVDYSHDLDKVEKITIDVAKKVQKTQPGAVPGFEPVMRYKEFADSNINFKVVLRAKTYGDQFALTHEFMKALKKRFDKENIEISWPIMKIYDMTRKTMKKGKK